jgi:hypothetical protein
MMAKFSYPKAVTNICIPVTLLWNELNLFISSKSNLIQNETLRKWMTKRIPNFNFLVSQTKKSRWIFSSTALKKPDSGLTAS